MEFVERGALAVTCSPVFFFNENVLDVIQPPAKQHLVAQRVVFAPMMLSMDTYLTCAKVPASKRKPCVRAQHVKVAQYADVHACCFAIPPCTASALCDAEGP
jgi:hypothetical protein